MQENKRSIFILTGGVLAVLCCALPIPALVATGAAFFGGFTLPWLVGAALLSVLLFAGLVWRIRTRRSECGCGPSCEPTHRGES